MLRIVCATLLALAGAVPATHAATVTVGLSELPDSPSGAYCDSYFGSCPVDLVTTVLPDDAGLDRVPYDGRIVAWRFRGGPGNGTAHLRVAHGTPPTLTSRAVSEPAPYDAYDGRRIELSSPLAAAAGDLIVLTLEADNNNASPHVDLIDLAGAEYHDRVGAWSDTGSATFNPAAEDRAPAYNAELEIYPPLVTSLSPDSGSGGTSVTITGDHFTGAERVTFGGVAAVFSVVSDTAITAAAPPGLAGPVPVVVEGPGGAGAPRTFTYPAAPPPPGDTTDPIVESLVVAPTAFRARKGTSIVYRLSEAAQTVFTVRRARKGRRKGGRCVVGRKSGKRCTRWRAVEGSVAHAGTAGLNELAFSARLAGKRLKRGRYRLTAVATDAAGNASAPVRKRFRIKR